MLLDVCVEKNDTHEAYEGWGWNSLQRRLYVIHVSAVVRSWESKYVATEDNINMVSTIAQMHNIYYLRSEHWRL
jgi:hypothetical protein